MNSFTGGDKLEKYLADLAKKVANPGTLHVGFLEGATYPDGASVAMVASVQEFGSSAVGIPPRPFFRNMIAEKGPTWGESLAQVLKYTNYDASAALELMGEGIKGQLQQSIIDTLAPALSPITLMLRRMRADDPDLEITGATVGEAARRVASGASTGGVSDKPLVDTGHMLASVDYEVSRSGE